MVRSFKECSLSIFVLWQRYGQTPHVWRLKEVARHLDATKSDSNATSACTLPMLWRKQTSIQGQTHKKTDDIYVTPQLLPSLYIKQYKNTISNYLFLHHSTRQLFKNKLLLKSTVKVDLHKMTLLIIIFITISGNFNSVLTKTSSETQWQKIGEKIVRDWIWLFPIVLIIRNRHDHLPFVLRGRHEPIALFINTTTA